MSGKPFSASSNTSGVLSVPCGNFLANSSTYFSSGKRSSSESTCDSIVNYKIRNFIFEWRKLKSLAVWVELLWVIYVISDILRQSSCFRCAPHDFSLKTTFFGFWYQIPNLNQSWLFWAIFSFRKLTELTSQNRRLSMSAKFRTKLTKYWLIMPRFSRKLIRFSRKVVLWPQHKIYCHIVFCLFAQYISVLKHSFRKNACSFHDKQKVIRLRESLPLLQ